MYAIRSYYGQNELTENELMTIERAKNSRQVIFSDLHLSDASANAISINLVIPLLAGDEVTGTILLKADPAEFLYPLMQTWPIKSRTGETILVKNEGNSVLYLSNLKFRRNNFV